MRVSHQFVALRLANSRFMRNHGRERKAGALLFINRGSGFKPRKAMSLAIGIIY
jgi:hypothetical protein